MAVDWLHLLSYARQPLVGAFTGYVTTDVAIRLLFRPLKPWRIFGVRVPLTPGVFPAKRYEFAEKVGKMVGSHLVTAEEVRKALVKEAFRRELQGAVNERLQDAFSRDFGTFASLFPSDFQQWMREMVGRLLQSGMRELFQYLDSAPFESELREFLMHKGDELLSGNLESVLSAEQFDALAAGLKDGVRELLHSRELARSAASFTDRKIEEFLGSGTPLREMLPAGLLQGLPAGIERELEEAMERLTADPSFRSHLRENLESGFKSAVGSMQGVSGFFAKFFDPGWIVSLYPEVISKVEQEALQLLRDQTTLRHASRSLLEAIDRFLAQSLAQAMERVPYRKAAALRRLARKQAVRMILSPQVATLLAAVVEGRVESLRHQPLGEVLTQALTKQGVEKLRERAAAEVLASLRSPTARRALERTVEEKVEEWLFHRPVGQLGALIPANTRDELAAMVYSQLSELLAAELPPLVDLMNVQEIVQDKVNSLDILDMEALLLDIMKESFMFLNLFGALLGFLIGIANLIVPGLG